MYYATRGRIPHKRHTQFRQPDGSLYHEELMGIHGFSGNKSLLYHLRPPTAVQRIEPGCEVKTNEAPQGPVRHRLLRTADIPAGGDAVQGRIPLMGNNDVRISLVRPQQAMNYWYRYAHGDEVIFVHEGAGVLESQFGTLRYGPGDYLVIPTGVIWRLLPDAGLAQRMLVVETASGHIEPPRRYINNHGQFLESAPYSERDIRPPDGSTARRDGRVRGAREGAGPHLAVLLQPPSARRRRLGRLPVAVRVQHQRLRADHRPGPSAAAGAPDVRRPGFVLCSFVPRLFDYHPEAIPAPYNHSNVDSDEVIYYVDGDFMSRRGIESASITVHPNGIPHGPAPGTYEGSIGKTETRELAVMVDTFRPLLLTQEALALEDEGLRVQLAIVRRPGGSHGRKEFRRVQRDDRAAVHAPSGGHRQRLHRLVRPRQHVARRAAPFHGAVFRVLEPVPAGGAQPRDQRRHAAGDARVQRDPDERARGHLQRPGREAARGRAEACAAASPDHDREGDPALVSTEGTVDGGTFRFQAAHFEWLLRFGQPLGLTFDDMGKRRHGTPSTLYFCDELFRLYGSDDYNEAMGAAFAVENWAAAGFWKELIAGLDASSANRCRRCRWRSSRGTTRSKSSTRATCGTSCGNATTRRSSAKSPSSARAIKMLDGVKAFWDGLERDRRDGKQFRKAS